MDFNIFSNGIMCYPLSTQKFDFPRGGYENGYLKKLLIKESRILNIKLTINDIF